MGWNLCPHQKMWQSLSNMGATPELKLYASHPTTPQIVYYIYTMFWSGSSAMTPYNSPNYESMALCSCHLPHLDHIKQCCWCNHQAEQQQQQLPEPCEPVLGSPQCRPHGGGNEEAGVGFQAGALCRMVCEPEEEGLCLEALKWAVRREHLLG